MYVSDEFVAEAIYFPKHQSRKVTWPTAVAGGFSLQLLEHWEDGFETRSGHKCMRLCVCVSSCIGRDFEIGTPVSKAPY